MTPAARIAAAIEVLDRILTGETAERALTGWGRANRFAGSGDRAALRDLVFDALRCRRSFALLGGGDDHHPTGRALMIGRLRAAGIAPETLMTGQGHAAPPPADHEAAVEPAGAAAFDVPDWLLPLFDDSLSPDSAPVLGAMRSRAPVILRVNAARADRAAAMARLAAEGIVAIPHPLARFALEVTGGERKIQTSTAYAEGLVELQDAASQAVVEVLPLRDGLRVLDHCAGGGGKTLAMGAQARLRLFAHDVAPRRMADLPARAARAGLTVTLTEKPEKTGPYDLVLIDAPCSGSGSWRRDPEGKWALTPDRLDQICAVQAGILDRVAPMVAPGGVLAYATCSLLAAENGGQVDAFLRRHSGWRLRETHRFTPLQRADGFFVAILDRI